ncbi:cation:proton antiporter [Jeotgalibacillus proteolyticus]|uniref:Sodium:proton antiporter n=1 Tax=Jeotgalibacillus proteolyticus TaxID=2082395 RepID=A0A2S5GCM2_9BACL|nr:sodium:proton antiporter [Jeotgalibacillus proteolyticus]PPA70661.1 sodium:proton antiporter [Jeotgalibacillus proteolyticus]
MEASHLIVLLLIGYIVFTIDNHAKAFPQPPILVLIGIGLSFIPFFSSMELTQKTLYEFFLPALLFISAYKYPSAALRKHGGVIGLLSTGGLIVTVGLLGGAIYYLASPFLALPFIGALIIAAILAPTDPISVTAILKQASGDETIADIVEGESMINDGTSIVVFTTLVTIVSSGKDLSALSVLGDFLLVSLGGIAIGLIFGWLVCKAVHYTHHKEFQVMLSIVLAYGNFFLAEALGVSGVLATVTAGIMLSWEFTHTNKEDHYRESLDGFWDIVEPTLLSLVFLTIGIIAPKYLDIKHLLLAFLIFIGSLIIRYIVIQLSLFTLPSTKKMGQSDALLISFAGVKGTMSVVLLLILETVNDENIQFYISVSFIAILLSLIIQSFGIYPLTKKLSK